MMCWRRDHIMAAGSGGRGGRYAACAARGLVAVVVRWLQPMKRTLLRIVFDPTIIVTLL